MTPHRLSLVAVVVLTIAHQDLWLWDDPTPVLGILPAGLAYHAAFSVVAAAVWGAVTIWAWPPDPLEGPPPAADEAQP